jgi:hypothetical protein
MGLFSRFTCHATEATPLLRRAYGAALHGDPQVLEAVPENSAVDWETAFKFLLNGLVLEDMRDGYWCQDDSMLLGLVAACSTRADAMLVDAVEKGVLIPLGDFDWGRRRRGWRPAA